VETECVETEVRGRSRVWCCQLLRQLLLPKTASQPPLCRRAENPSPTASHSSPSHSSPSHWCVPALHKPSECSRRVLASLSRDSRALTRRSRRLQTFVLHLPSLHLTPLRQASPRSLFSAGSYPFVRPVPSRTPSPSIWRYHYQRHRALPHFRRLARLSIEKRLCISEPSILTDY
jgi:hypothetical protein